MSTHREIEQVYLEDIAKKSKMIKEAGESLKDMEKGDRTPAQWLRKNKRRKKVNKNIKTFP